MTIPTGDQHPPLCEQQPLPEYTQSGQSLQEAPHAPQSQRSAVGSGAAAAFILKVLPLAWARRKLRAAVRPRRVLGVLLTLGMAFAAFHVVFRTELLAPLLAQAAPLQEGVDWILEDPSRMVTSLCVLIIPHLGLYHLIFERR